MKEWYPLLDTRLWQEKNEKICILRSRTIDKFVIASYNIYIIKQQIKHTEVRIMTTRKLRQMLTEVENQNMTVKELRAILFEVEDQDAELKPVDLMKLTFGK